MKTRMMAGFEANGAFKGGGKGVVYSHWAAHSKPKQKRHLSTTHSAGSNQDRVAWPITLGAHTHPRTATKAASSCRCLSNGTTLFPPDFELSESGLLEDLP